VRKEDHIGERGKKNRKGTCACAKVLGLVGLLHHVWLQKVEKQREKPKRKQEENQKGRLQSICEHLLLPKMSPHKFYFFFLFLSLILLHVMPYILKHALICFESSTVIVETLLQ